MSTTMKGIVMGNEVRIWTQEALDLWLDDCPSYEAAKEADRKQTGLARSLGEVSRILRARGWRVRLDRKVDPIIRFHHRVGINPRSRLEIHVKLCGRRLAVEFFQNVHVENPNGGRYDFHKFERMTYVQRLETVHLVGLISERLAELHDCPVNRRPRGFGVREGLMNGSTFDQWWNAEKACGCHYKPELGRATYTNEDRDRTGIDGCLLEHLGEGWTLDNGRWVRGELHYDLGTRWVLKTSKHSKLHLDRHDIRATRPEPIRGRQITPEEALKRVRVLMARAVEAERYGDAARFTAVLGGLQEKGASR